MERLHQPGAGGPRDLDAQAVRAAVRDERATAPPEVPAADRHSQAAGVGRGGGGAIGDAGRRRAEGAGAGGRGEDRHGGDVYLAMMSRGYRGEVYTLDDFTLRGRDWAALAGFLGTAALAFWLGQ
jgi:hypothetical protein